MGYRKVILVGVAVVLAVLLALNIFTENSYKYRIEKVCVDLCQRFGYAGKVYFLSEQHNNTISEGTVNCLCYLDNKPKIAISMNYTINELMLLELRTFRYYD